MAFVLRDVSQDRAYWMVDQATIAKFNTVVVTITDGVKLRHAPWKSLPAAWSLDDFTKWVVYVLNKGMVVVPELQLLTHQEKLFQNNFPSLMFNESTYDPRKGQLYEKIALLLDEIVEITHAPAMHIGHDEVVGHISSSSMEKWRRTGVAMLPAGLFLQDVLHIHGYLKNRGIETWMWGDMLIAPTEFPEMLDKHLHGASNGYGKSLRDKLPRDIVICDWHYFDEQTEFPSLSMMQSEGFKVIGVTWSKSKTIHNFSRYAKRKNAYGMLATTWFHVQRKEWDVVDRILYESGEVFSTDFTDTK